MKQHMLLPGVVLPRLPDAGTPPEPASAPSPPAGEEQWPPLHELLGSLIVFEPQHAQSPPVVVLGLGMGARPLTPEQQAELDQAQVVAGGRAQLDRLVPGWQDDTRPLREYLPLRAPLEPLLTRLEACRSAGRRVLVLADGDPLFFGIGATLTRRWGATALRILPGLSSLQEACARAGLPWHDVRNVSLHGRGSWRDFNVAVTRGRPVCVLTDAASSPDMLARHLLDRGVEWFDMQVYQRLGMEDESSRVFSLREAAAQEGFDPGCTVLLRPRGAVRRPTLGLCDATLAVEHNLITKGPVRAAALSLLRLSPDHTLWDVGSGSGAVALEACALAHEGCVVAVERSPGRALGIRENRRRCGAAILEVHTGIAPDCFPHLPAPDRIFIGGGCGGDMAEDLLEEACRCLRPGGRLVVSCVLMGTMHTALECLRRTGWPVDMLAVQAAESAPLADDIRLVPLNPVFLVSCQKPEDQSS